MSLEGNFESLPLGVTLLDLPGLFDVIEARSGVAVDFIYQCDYLWIVGVTVDGIAYMLQANTY